MNQEKLEKRKSESGRQFDNIWKDHHNPKKRERVELKKQREQRLLKKKKDYGL